MPGLNENWREKSKKKFKIKRKKKHFAKESHFLSQHVIGYPNAKRV